MLKKIFTLLLSITLLLFGLTFAGTYDNQINKCLNKLQEEVNSEYSKDISSVTVDGEDSDLSVYTGTPTTTGQRVFNEVLKSNSTTKGCESVHSISECNSTFDNVFFAKRNNISTVKITPEIEGSGYWTMTELVTWGGSTEFDFPLQKGDDPQFDSYSYYSEGDDYGIFRENLIYVQYLLDGKFLSCGYINLDADNLDNINQNNYMGNGYEEGGFEAIGDWDIGGDNFFGMKVLIKGLDWDRNDLFDLNLISISYDNDSSYFNEYISFPLQIKAMNNVESMASTDNTMQNVMAEYQDYLNDNTCFEILHNSTSTLPSFCGGDYKSKSDLVSYNGLGGKSDSLFASLFNSFFPNVHALDMTKEQKNKAQKQLDKNSTATRNGIKLSTRQKINNLKDKTLKSRFTYILSPGSEVAIEKKLEKGKYVPYNQKIFKKCPLTHGEIAKNVEYVFKNYYSGGKLNLSSPKYPNPEFGDCMIPYPDVRHKDKLVKNSFIENKINFIKIKFGEKKVEEYEQKISQVTNNYEKKISDLKKKHKESFFSDNQEKAEKIKNQIKTIQDKMENNINKIASNDDDLSKYIHTKEEAFENVPSKELNSEKNKGKKTYLYIVFITLGVILIIGGLFLISNKNKND